jgi:hypothetical protein
MIKDALNKGYTVNNIVDYLCGANGGAGAGVSEATLRTHINRALSNKSAKPRKMRGDLNIQRVNRGDHAERSERQERGERGERTE